MSDQLLPPVEPNQLRISVEAGEDYEPSERVAAAIAELRDALADESDDVAGFGFWPLQLTFAYDSLRPTTQQNTFEEYKVTYTELDGR